jgi:hypothetical protein
MAILSKEQVPNNEQELKALYGEFTYTELSKGAVQMTGSWEKKNLIVLKDPAGCKVPIQIHKVLADTFVDCLTRAITTCPTYKIKQLGGYCPRHKMGDVRRGLSIHSWGAAFDINWAMNGVGKSAPHDLPEDFMKVFEDAGWVWGGRWSEPDWMHAQFSKVF